MWSVEFRSHFQMGDGLMELAICAWNEAPREKEDEDE
jgi:hypothetical protein